MLVVGIEVVVLGVGVLNAFLTLEGLPVGFETKVPRALASVTAAGVTDVESVC